LSRKLKRGTYELVDRRQRQRQEPKRFSRLPLQWKILTGRDFNDSGEAKDGAHTTELLRRRRRRR
jgi:hypothetical protein